MDHIEAYLQNLSDGDLLLEFDYAQGNAAVFRHYARTYATCGYEDAAGDSEDYLAQVQAEMDRREGLTRSNI